jgi:hypothetical protein
MKGFDTFNISIQCGFRKYKTKQSFGVSGPQKVPGVNPNYWISVKKEEALPLLRQPALVLVGQLQLQV